MGIGVSPCHGTYLNDTRLCTGILSAGTINTGDAGGEMTAADNEWIYISDNRQNRCYFGGGFAGC